MFASFCKNLDNLVGNVNEELPICSVATGDLIICIRGAGTKIFKI